MLKQITGTIAARIVTTVMGLLIAVIAGHRLGAAGLGAIGLIVLGITLIRLGTDLIGGGGLVYLVPRVPLGRILPPAYSWAVVATAVGCALLFVFRLVPDGYALHVSALALMQGVYAIHLNVLIGQQRIKAHNLITVFQSLVLVVVFALLASKPGADAHAFVEANYLAFGTAVLFSSIAMRKNIAQKSEARTDVWKLLWRQGALTQGANAMQFLNYRLAYWLIERFQGLPALGVYSVANQLAEGSWLGPKSLGMVLYSKMSNTEGRAEQRLLTLSVLKASMAFATVVVLALVLLPDQIYQWAFGSEVLGLRPIILILVPGILAMSASQAFSHFFSGTARNKHNMIGSGLGLLITVAAGLLLIPEYGLKGAALSATMAYLMNSGYQAIAFMRITGSSFKDLWPNRADIRRLRSLFSQVVHR